MSNDFSIYLSLTQTGDELPTRAFPVDIEAPVLSGCTSLTASGILPIVDGACDLSYDELRQSLTMWRNIVYKFKLDNYQNYKIQ